MTSSIPVYIPKTPTPSAIHVWIRGLGFKHINFEGTVWNLSTFSLKMVVAEVFGAAAPAGHLVSVDYQLEEPVEIKGYKNVNCMQKINLNIPAIVI